MKLPADSHQKMISAYQLLGQDLISIATFENIRILLKGIHPEIDSKLEVCSKAFDRLQKIQNGDIITLSAEALPEENEKQMKRKKALLFFIQSIKDLQSEVKRIEKEFSQGSGNTIWSAGRVIKYAKGPFGIITMAAVIVVIGLLIFKPSTTVKTNVTGVIPSPSGKQIQVITYQGHNIPVSEFFIGHGPDCDSPHYHAPNETTVTALDGTILQDPGGCGFGKVKDTQVTTVSQ